VHIILLNVDVYCVENIGASREAIIQGDFRPDNPSLRDVSSPARDTFVNDKQLNAGVFKENAADSVLPPRRKISSTTDEEYETASEDVDDAAPAPRRAPKSARFDAAQYSVSSSSSSSHDVSCSSSSSSTPPSIRSSIVKLGRTDSVSSAPPSTGWSGLPVPDQSRAMQLNGHEVTTIANVAAAVTFGTALTDAVNPVSGTPGKGDPGSSKVPLNRLTSRKPTLNPNPRPSRSLFCLRLSNPIRKFCIRIVEYKYPFTSHG